MTFWQTTTVKRQPRGFTLIELLAALAFMAVVVPAVMQGLKIAALAGEVSQRKSVAARIGERVLTESILTGQYQSVQNGTERSGGGEYRWNLHDTPWKLAASTLSVNNANGINSSVVNANTLHELSVDVTFSAQGKDYSVHLATLINDTQRANATAPPPMLNATK